MSEILLCRPCAEQAKEENKVKIIASVAEKCTCANCGRRRFVYKCTKKEPQK